MNLKDFTSSEEEHIPEFDFERSILRLPEQKSVLEESTKLVHQNEAAIRTRICNK